MATTAELRIGEMVLSLPIIIGTEQEVGIDVAVLRDKTGAITLDPGYGNTGACESAITFLDGERGILRYRGYPIEQLAENATFLEVAWLLLKGDLPTRDELAGFEEAVKKHTLLHEDMKRMFAAFPKDAHPMAILSSVVLGLSAYYGKEPREIGFGGIELDVIRLIAKLPTIAAFAYRTSMGLPLIYPDNGLDYSSNFLKMMFGFPTEDFQADPDIARALDRLFILHADHEQNCSTSTVRLVGSSQANLFASVAAGICALWGPLHGGANQAVIEMLDEITARGGDVSWAVAQAKDKNSGFRLMGFGHRVYKNFDPRAKIIKTQADIVLDKLGRTDPQLELARGLEAAALSDDYFVQRKLYPNVDFYSGIIYRSMGFPVTMFTVLFALGRLPGWIAHWREHNAGKARIGRPRQIYTGPTERNVVEIGQR
ncbi:MAG: citrate synthase [Myxococcales bacterium]|nr:citrate synthase [Myxococcales bacterium]